MKILLAEDTKDMNRVITAMLEHEGYDVDSAFDGEEALGLIQTNGYDGVILDIMMPKKSGLEVLTEMRRNKIITPVLMLTAKAEVDDRVAGLDAGADDYLTKPFAGKELLARVRAMVRRKNSYGTEELKYEDIRLDGAKFELASENSVRLSVKEFELLQTLVINADKELDSSYLLTHVWQDTEADDDTVWLYVMYLRSKLRAVSSVLTISGNKGERFRLVKGEDGK